MTHSYATAARLLLAAVLSAGLVIVVGTLEAPTVDASNTINLSLTWQSELNDAPCGVAASVTRRSSTTTAHRRLRSAIARATSTRLILRARPRATVGTWVEYRNRNRCRSGHGMQPTDVECGHGPERKPRLSRCLVAHPSTRPHRSIRATATCCSTRETPPKPVDGGYYDYAPGGSEVWNQVVTNPPTDTVPNGGVQASCQHR